MLNGQKLRWQVPSLSSNGWKILIYYLTEQAQANTGDNYKTSLEDMYIDRYDCIDWHLGVYQTVWVNMKVEKR